MTDHPATPALDGLISAPLGELMRLLTLSAGEFELILAVCNASSLRQQLIEQIHQHQPYPIADVALTPHTFSLYQAVVEVLQHRPGQAAMVTNLESAPDLDQLLIGANQIREEFRKLGVPLILWISDWGLQRLIRGTPDLYSWADTVEFVTPAATYLDFLQTLSQQVWNRVLNSCENQFLTRADLGLDPGSPQVVELDLALANLDEHCIPPDLKADLAFVQGRMADRPEEARAQFETSLALWQTLAATEAQEQASAWPQAQERVGHLLFYLGLWWRGQAARDRAETPQALEQAEDYFQRAIARFEQGNQPEWAAAYLNYWAESLQRQGKWAELEALIRRALPLHEQYSDPLRQARIYGFWAETDLARGDAAAAQDHANQALTRQSQVTATDPEQQARLNWEQAFSRGWYLFSLGKAQALLGQPDEALATLETAKELTRPDYDPDLYRRILEALAAGYFDQGNYKRAFETRQDKAAIESRFSFRAFIGAGRIQPKQSVTNPALPGLVESETIAPEIIASGREADVNRLVQRIQRDDKRLTVIYGPSGVGKSSIIEAGLVPALEQVRIDGRRVLVILQRVYHNWPQELHQQLDEALARLPGGAIATPTPIPGTPPLAPPSPHPDSPSTAAIDSFLGRLQEISQKKRTVALIFDQFEEFFFDYQASGQRREFYTFLQRCLGTPFVNVVLSLREDYLSYVLEGERLVVAPDNQGQDLLDDVLKKDNREYLGNFSPTETRQVIQGLITQTAYTPEPELIDQLVTDLAAELGEVRPIELQIMGAQLQAENITTLAAYQALATPGDTPAKTTLTPKGELIHHYLDAIVDACGPDQETIARVVLYLLTDEHNTRPLKTREDLEKGLTSLGVPHTDTALSLVLEILVGSRLVFAIPTQPQAQFQLVHDYLATFVRRQQEDGLVATLRQAQQDRQQAEADRQRAVARSNKILRVALAGAGVAMAILAGLSLFAWQKARQASQGEVNALASSAQAKLAAGQDIEALTEAIALGHLLHHQRQASLSNKNLNALLAIQQVVYGVRERNRLEGFGDTVNRASFSPNGDLMVTTDAAETIKLWTREGALVATLPQQPDDVYAATFSPDGQTFATAGFDNTVKLWSRQGELLQTFTGHTGWVYDIRFSPNGQTLASASEDRTIKLWRPDGTLQHTLTGHTDRVLSVDFSPDGQTLVSASDDNTLKLWTLSGQLVQTLTGHGGGVKSVRFNPEGNLIASASDDRTIKLWSAQGQLLQTMAGHGEGVRAVTFSPDGQTLASASDDETVRLWSLRGDSLATLRGHTAAVWGVTFSPDGQTLASTSRDKTVKLWDLGAAPKQDLIGHVNAVMSVTYSPDGQTLASGSSDQTVRLWRPDGTFVKQLTGHRNIVWEVSFSPNGQTLASASQDGTVRLWGLDGELQATLTGHSGPVYGVSFSSDGQRLASGGFDGTVRIWDSTGELYRTLKGHTNTVIKVRFSPDGQTLASTSWDRTVRLWSPEGELRHTLTGHEDTVYDVAFSPTGDQLASASWDGTVKLWTVQGKLLRTIEAGLGEARIVRFSPDGQWLAVGGEDGTIRLWNPNGQLLKVLRGHEAMIQGLSFSPDGQTLASASNDKRLMLWDLTAWTLDLDTLLQRGCAHLADYLTYHPDTLQELTACHSPALLQRAATALVAAAQSLAQQGEVKAAAQQLRQAKTWDPSLEFDPRRQAKTWANQAQAQRQVEAGVQGVVSGQLEEARAAFKAAQTLVPDLDLPAATLADLCLYGSLNGEATTVLAACDKMVALDGRPVLIGRRGLARALVGDTPGALEDFQTYVAWLQQQAIDPAQKQSLLTSRQQWIKALESGDNPFTPEELERLRTDWSH